MGRQPLRKLGRRERFIAPAAELAERGLPVEGLLAAVGAALRFDVPSDPESVELQALVGTAGTASALVHERRRGIGAGHPLRRTGDASRVARTGYARRRARSAAAPRRSPGSTGENARNHLELILGVLHACFGMPDGP